jgi:hypothetical protein
MALEVFHALDLGKLRFRQRAVGHDHETRGKLVAAIRRQPPQLRFLIPVRRRHGRLKHRQIVKIVLPGNRLAVREDLRPLGEEALRHVVQLIQQRQVIVGRDVARRAGIAVPVPRAAHVRPALHDADALHPALAQPRRRQQRRESAADEQAFDEILDRLARDDRLGPRIGLIPSELPGQVGGVLRQALRAVRQSLVALLGELGFHLVIEFLRLVRRHRGVEHCPSCHLVGIVDPWRFNRRCRIGHSWHLLPRFAFVA